MRAALAALLASVCLLRSAEIRPPARVYVTATGAALVKKGLAQASPADSSEFLKVTAPRIRPGSISASATQDPWIEMNGFRYRRGVTKAIYTPLAVGTAHAAVAEAFAYGVDAILDVAAADVTNLEKMLAFLQPLRAPAMPVMANIGVIDDSSAVLPEVLNLLTRRNLLYRVVKQPAPGLDLNIRLGERDFPVQRAKNPSEFAQMVRQKLTDDKRLLRLYGTSTTIATLNGDGRAVRLCLLIYGRNRFQPNIRVRLLGKYTVSQFAGFGSQPDAQISEFEHINGGTEFLLPPFDTIAVIDLKK